MSSAYKFMPEYPSKPMSLSARREAYEEFIDVADIDFDCPRNPNGHYIGKNVRIEIAALALSEALTQLKLLKIVEFSNAHTVLVNPSAMLFPDKYKEDHTKEAFRFAPGSDQQYYWDGPRGTLREVQEIQERYDELKEAGHLNPISPLSRRIGQFTPRKDPS